jgi:diaminohydroxyphosphoribosylaminopyrimidine deaminase / 5-amino-6-(5-phosphoribosylamino)uracil reductase
MNAAVDTVLMRKCLALATRGAGFVSPNPLVGAILVDRRGKILASGYHRVFGGPHAEVECLDRCRGGAAGTTLYVNLEPCVHHGKTPPCTERIIRAGIRRVVIAIPDPNPLVAGRGIALLRRAGISVRVGLCAEEARSLNRHFLRHISSRMPYVHMKVAQTVDGKIAARGHRQIWISSPESRTLVHRWRATHDAVLVGAGTIRADNPRLDVRRVHGRNPDVVILDGNLRVSTLARVFRDTRSRRVFVCTTRTKNPRRVQAIRRMSLSGVVVLELPGAGHRLLLRRVLSELYRHNIGSILVEGGGDVFTQFVEEGLVDELSLFYAPTLLPGGVPAFGSSTRRGGRTRRPGNICVCSVGKDALVNVRW